MNQEQREFLNLEKRPARLSSVEVSWLLGCAPHDVSQLVRVGLLRPLGHPGANAPKFFAAVDVETYMQDRKWLARATDAIQTFWRSQNGRRPDRVTVRQRRNGKKAIFVRLTERESNENPHGNAEDRNHQND
jgi:hypothetical protein